MLLLDGKRDEAARTEALRLLSALAEKGDVNAQLFLGRTYLFGLDGVAKDAEKAEHWLAIAEKVKPEAEFLLATSYLDEKSHPLLTSAQLMTLSRVSHRASLIGCALGEILYEGRRAAKNEKLAVALLEPCANTGGLLAQRLLARIYAYGGSEIRDLAKAKLWMERVALADRGIGYYDYAHLLYEIDPVKNKDEILKWLEKSKVEKNPRTEGLLLKMKGEDKRITEIKSDLVEQVKTGTVTPGVDRAKAEAGNTVEQLNLGEALITGSGAPPDPDEGAKWITRAAEAGLPEAQYRLGLLYEQGRGVYQNDRTAFSWIEKAARQGLASAQQHLSEMYEKGTGVPGDKDQAAVWRDKAKAQGYKPADTTSTTTSVAGKSFDISCKPLSKPEVHIKIEFAPVTYDNSLSREKMTLRRTGMFSKSDPSHELGMHDGDISHVGNTGFSFLREYNEAGKGDCLGYSDLKMTLTYSSKIYIINEYGEKSCEYSNIKTHELKHRAVDEKLYTEYAPVLEKYISESLFNLPPVGPLDARLVDGKKRDMLLALRDKIHEAIRRLSEERMRRQTDVDTPEEYAKNPSVCPSSAQGGK
jgi:TPR repeat protein